MKKLLISLLAVAALALLLAPTSGAASLNNFVISDYDIDFNLSRDADNRSVLYTTETIQARFPSYDQNHGIERYLPNKYDGHSVRLKVESVTDQNGKKWQYETRRQGGDTIIRIGDGDEYVHGLQTFKIKYSQHDVTKYFADNDSDEFYWNTVGTNWQVPIANLSVNLTVDESLATQLNGNQACYFGQQGSSDLCQLAVAGNSYSVAASNLRRGDNISLAVGFKPGTFAEFKMTPAMIFQQVWIYAQVVLTGLMVVLIVWLTVRYSRQTNRTPEQKPIAPEYLVPDDASVIVSAKLMGGFNSFAALILDLAIRRYVQIREVKAKKFFTNAEYEIEIIKPIDDLRAEESEVMRDIFVDQVAVGAKLNMKTLQSNLKVQKRIQDNPEKIIKLVRGDYGLRAKGVEQGKWYKKFALISLVFAVLLLSPGLLLVSLTSMFMSWTIWPLTDKGLALVRYLKGLKMYIKLAEADRINTLQSPEGVEKVGDISDKAKLIKLYEKLLPYAVLFGVESDWNKQLGRHYEDLKQQPDWYTGTSGIYSAAAFSTAMSSFKSTSSVSAASASGGSSGGGYSGGGGGGGGGGGW